MTNKYDLAIETLDLYFDTQRKETLQNIPYGEELIELLNSKGVEDAKERAEAIEFAYPLWDKIKKPIDIKPSTSTT